MCEYLHFGKRITHQHDPGNPLLAEWIHYPENNRWEASLTTGEIIFVISGSLNLSYEDYQSQQISDGKILLFPPGCQYHAQTIEEMSALILRFHSMEHPFRSINPDDLNNSKQHFDKSFGILKINQTVSSYLNFFKESYISGVQSNDFIQLKIEEFFFLIRAYYTREELAIFFRPLISNNTKFMDFVLRNYDKVKTVGEFAELYACSVSHFEKKFKQTFNISPYQWMLKKKIKVLYKEINTTDKLFCQIAREQGFSSLPQFTDFCKKHFGHSPSQMRKLTDIRYKQNEK